MTKRAEKITWYLKRLELLDPESDKYQEIYNEYKAYINRKI